VKLLLDINVLLDVLLDREPWSAAASLLLAEIECGSAEGYVAAHTLPTVYYVVGRAGDRKLAAAAVGDLLRILDIAQVTRMELQEALTYSVPDFEDAVQAAAARAIGADYLVTRNERDFRDSPVPVADPPTVLALL
jgi:predicted nucleic acid-binding protein